MGPDPVVAVTEGLADRLKAATADQHAAAENHTFQRSLVQGEVSRAAFVTHQSGMLDLVRLIHARLLDRGPVWQPFAEAMGGHAERLAADLADLRNGASAVAHSGAVRKFADGLGGDAWSAEAALGAFYVIEGSMNGNRFIRRAVADKRPELEPSLRYFDPYGPNQRARWKEFRSAIDRVGRTLPEPEEAVRAARETFILAAALAGEAAAA